MSRRVMVGLVYDEPCDVGGCPTWRSEISSYHILVHDLGAHLGLSALTACEALEFLLRKVSSWELVVLWF